MSDTIREAFDHIHAKIIDGRIASAFSIFKEGYEAGAALAQQPAQAAAVPDGWKLVPVEPTREMWAAAGDCVTTLQWSGIAHHDKISGAVYRAMLAAAPAAPAQEGKSHE